MDIYLPIARVEIATFLIFGLGGMVGLLSGLFGVGGGFLLTPLLMMIGIPPAVAAASDTNQVVAASVSGTIAHSRNGNVDFRLGLIIVAGGLLGGTYGATLVRALRTAGNFEVVVKLAYVLMLLIIGLFMFFESLKAIRSKGDREIKSNSAVLRLAKRLPLQVDFPVSGISCSAVMLFVLGLLIGLLAALMGVGGGFIMLPVMIYVLGMPTHKAVGTSIFTVVFTAINVTLAQSILNHSVDIILALILLVGSSLGAHFGEKIGRNLKAERLRIIFSLLVLGVMTKMMIELLKFPASLIAIGGGH